MAERAAASARRPPRPAAEVPARPWEPTAIPRSDTVWAAAVAALSAALFATTLYGHPGLGDAPESVAGIASTGVLHAPGYPAYVIAGKLFTALVPFGSFAFQVNLFSLFCAALTVAGVYLLARRCGAARWASALGALALASGGAFWFYADFAKHDAFSGLLYLIALYLLISWQSNPSGKKLIGLGAVMGIGIGSSWPLMVFLVPTVALGIFLGRRHVSLRSLALATAVGAVVVVGLYGFVMVRAAQDPAINWGGATSLGRLIDLVNRADFKGAPSGTDAPAAGQASSGRTPLLPPAEVRTAGTPKQSGTYLAIFFHEVGLCALALAAFGAVVSLAWRRERHSYPLLLAFVVNLVGAALIVGASAYEGFDTVLIQEGFILGCLLILPVWLAIGATELEYRAAERGGAFNRDAQRRAVKWAAPPLLGVAVLLPSLISHWDVPRRNNAPLADRYAESSFAELPRRAVLFINGAERTQPLIYRQVVIGDRPDVDVVASDGLSYEWYREQIGERLGVELPPRVGSPASDAVSAINALRGKRPVYMDLFTAQPLRGQIGYRQIGLLARLTEGKGEAKIADPGRVAGALRAAEETAGLPDPDWRVWPSNYALGTYISAGLGVAGAYFDQRDQDGLRRALQEVLRVDPANREARHNLEIIDSGGFSGG